MNTSTETKQKEKPLRLPDWFRIKKSKLSATKKLSDYLQSEVPNSICEEAKCPNRSECFDKGVLTFMILGTICTRNCTFCSVDFGKPLAPDPNEAQIILNAIEKLKLKFVVMTSPNRDDLPDEGAGHYATIIQAIKQKYADIKVEVLIPDFKGKSDCLQTVIDAQPDVINHNIETVPSLYRFVRKGSLYKRSLDLLSNIKAASPKMLTKSGVMLGLGETQSELIQTFKDLKAAQIDILTLGQYLKPSRQSAEVKKYYHPDEFELFKKMAQEVGIRYVFSGPLVRSSYLAEHVFEDLVKPVQT